MENESEQDCLKLDRQLCFPLYAAARKVIGQYSEPLERIGLTYTQYVVMLVLWEQKTVSVKELGKRLYLDSGTLTPLLKAMEKKGLVARTRSKEDERVVLITATKEGLALREPTKEVQRAVASCARLSPEDACALHGLLVKLLATFSEE